METVLIPFADHGFDVRTGSFCEQLARARTPDFLRRHIAAQ